MNIEAVILGIALFLAGYYAGYSIGFRRCFEYFMARLIDIKEENDDNM